MAKSESTAVNELISLVQNGRHAEEPAQDLFAAPKSRAPSPQPLERAPTGTSQLHLNNGKPVRMITAPPTRTQSIPPLPQSRAQVRASTPPPRPSTQMPTAQAARPSTQMPTAQAARPSGAKLPPPRPSPRASGQHAAIDPARASTQLPAVDPIAAMAASPAASPVAKAPATTLPPPSQLRAPAPSSEPPTKKLTPSNAIPAQRTTPPKSSPIAAPFEQRVYGQPAYERAAIDKTGDSVSADNWFEASRAVEKIEETWVTTSPAPKRKDHSTAIKRVLLPLVVLSVVSAGVAYVVFVHHGKKAAPAITHVTAPAKPTVTPQIDVAPAPSTESANAATATAGGTQPEPPAPAAAPAPTQDQAALTPHPNANDQKIVAKDPSESPAPAPQQVAAPARQQVAAAAPAPDAPQPAGKVNTIAEAAPVIHEVQGAHGVVKLVDVRIDSKPAGATVMLVDNGKTSFLGTTPVAASVDPSRAYDVVLTLEGRPTQIAHLDPTKAQKLEITLAKSGPARVETAKAPAIATTAPKAAAPSAPKAPARAAHAKKSSAPSGSLADPGFDTAKSDEPKTEAPAEAPKAAAPKAAEGGDGTLMVSSKPPCQIWIDGKDTGLTTPQRSMSLPAGSHHVTFVNSEQNITKTVGVKITAGESTKLIQNLLSN
ncbi:MAG: PEGA domain-containing protein [Deltaproteobacteria bacterium]|nr:PEGA domain-containing protein [Deltaproteobacteria bacterium]